ncbi:type III pantothenate kinase [Algoriphagus namhaensis]|uniref:Type III pantothenate kinase n=1 Tax=Algoriphagus namhaensis TaxID=915353 RepID=A0ABV8AQY0_9BACT
MPNLCIDIGNSRIKSALFEGEDLLVESTFGSLENAIESWILMDFDACIVSSVRYSREVLHVQLPFEHLFLDHQTPTPLKNEYQSQSTLGLDRLAGAVGAWSRAGGGSVLAIDLGTCITFDWVDGNATYQGGAISPGLRLRAESMHSLTANLPLVALDAPVTFRVGKTTVDCMKTGIWQGIVYEVMGQIDSYRQEFPEIKAFISGGDSHFFDSLAKDHIFVVPNLVLVGLNCILNHNVE